MTKSWRPKGWSSPYGKDIWIHCDNAYYAMDSDKIYVKEYLLNDIYEAGADAILKALRGLGDRINVTDQWDNEPPYNVSLNLLVIPDDKE